MPRTLPRTWGLSLNCAQGSGWAAFAANAGFNLASGTLVFWLYLPQVPSVDGTLLSIGTATGSLWYSQMYWQASSRRLVWQQFRGSSSATGISQTTNGGGMPLTRGWHMVSFGWDGTGAEVTIDGVSLVGVTPGNWLLTLTGNADMRLGVLFNGSGALGGLYTAIRGYTTRRSAAEMLTLYQSYVNALPTIADPIAPAFTYDFDVSTLAPTIGSTPAPTLTNAKPSLRAPSKRRRRARVYPGAVAVTSTTGKIDFGTHAVYNLASWTVSVEYAPDPTLSETLSNWRLISLHDGTRGAEVYLDSPAVNGPIPWSAIGATASAGLVPSEPGRYHHVVVTCTMGGGASGLRVYVDGVCVLVGNAPSAAFASNPRLQLAQYIGGGAVARGTYTDLRLYSGIASPAEVQDLYFEGADPSSLTKVASWNFSDLAGTTVTLSSGTGNNGAITGGAWSRVLPHAARASVVGRSLSSGRTLIV